MANSPHRNYPLPDEERKVNEEFWKLALETIPLIDHDIHLLFQALALVAARDHGHDIDGIEGLRTALEGKMSASQTFRLADLVDVEGANEAPDGYVLVKVSGKYVAMAASAAIGEHEHSVDQINGLGDLLDDFGAAKLNKDGSNASEGMGWALMPMGVPIKAFDHLSGFVPPPTDKGFRYIKLTAGDPYNDGVLIGETISGAAPNLTAVATINFTGSPYHGDIAPLINTDRRFVRAGVSGEKRQSQNLSHNHDGRTTEDGEHVHTGTRANSASSLGANVMAQSNSNGTYTTPPAGKHRHLLEINANGGPEAHPAYIGATYYMRIM